MRWSGTVDSHDIEILPVVPLRVTTKEADTDVRRPERWAWSVIVFAWVYLLAQVLRAVLRGRVF